MKWRYTAAVWLSAWLVWGYVFWTIQQRGGLALEEEVASLAPIVRADSARVDAVHIERGGRTLEFTRRNGRWVVTDPVGASVSSDLIAALIDTLATIAPVEIVAENPDSLLPFGLDPPRTVIRMAAAGTPVAAVELGERNPTRTAVYARRRGGKQVYLLGLNAEYYVELIYEQAYGAVERLDSISPID